MKELNAVLLRLLAAACMLAMLLGTYSPAYAATPDYRFWDQLLAPGSSPGYAWTNGSIGAGYTEGQAVPMNLKITGLSTGTWGFNIYYDWYDENKDICGIWKIVEYDVDVSPSGYRDDVTPVEDLDAQFPDAPAGNRMFVGANGGSVDVTNIGASVQVGTTNLIKRYLPVTFTVSGANVTAYFYFGVYLSLMNENGAACQGLTAFPGKSSQTDIGATPTISGVTSTNMIGGGGTISIDSSAIAPAAISGLKYYDLDGDHAYDAGEPLLQGWQIKACTDASCTTVVKSMLTNENGLYSFNLSNGTYYACETLQASWAQSEPYPPGCYGPIVVDSDQHPNMDFGNIWDADWGDLPETYGTQYPNGAAHLTGNLQLGALHDIEPQGQPSPTALGDDNLNVSDEDGVNLAVFTEISQVLVLHVNCTSPTLTSATVVAWFDWDNSGAFSAAEITFNQAVTCSPTGSLNILTTNYGSLASAGSYSYPDPLYYRVRLYETVSTPSPTGLVSNGEVEDYYFTGPTAVTISEPAAVDAAQLIRVTWQTFDEREIVSFKLYRSLDPVGSDRLLVYSTAAKYKGQFLGYLYSFADTDVQPGQTYTYWLEVLHTNGTSVTMNPASATFYLKAYLPAILR